MKTLTDLEKRKQQLLEELASLNSEIVNNYNTKVNNITNAIKERIRTIEKQLPELKIEYNISNYEDSYIDLDISFNIVNDEDDYGIYFKKFKIEDIESEDDLDLLDDFISKIPKLKSILKLIETFNTKFHYRFTNYNNLALELEKWRYGNDDTRKQIKAEISNIDDNGNCELLLSISLELNNCAVYKYNVSDDNFNYSVEFEITTEGYDAPEIKRTYKTEFDKVKTHDIQDIIKHFEQTVDKNDIIYKLEKLTKKGDDNE